MRSTERKRSQISCSTFDIKEQSLIEIFKRINEAKSISERAENAKILLQSIEDVFPCPYYESKNPDCRYCKKLLTLRKNVAELLITQA